ncbi:hypothetical protein R1sor_007105 [Riccia sorocarpa]|uniref:HAT C-terminal dimerisation domain-containing protein n=1 Tax=Riccia sorocarpa TaxID=122646 RepID=A0ABD3HVT1_9MARC
MVAFIKNHHMTNAIFIDKFSDGLTLLRPGATHFMTNFIMIDRAYALRYCLKEMTASKEWEKYEGGITDWTANGKCMETRLSIEDKNFWDEIHDLLWLIHPIWVLLRKVDNHRHFIGHIYWESWNLEDILKKMHTNVKLKFRLLTQERCELISVNAHARWEMWNNELHPTAMLLMPFYFTKPTALPYLQIEHVKQSFRRCERNWSSFSHIHNKKRNQLTVERVDKLVYVAFNKNISSIHRKLERQGAKTLNKYLRSHGKQQKIRRFVDEHEEPTKFGCDLSKWLDDQAEDNEVRGRTEAPAFARETSEPHTAPSEER